MSNSSIYGIRIQIINIYHPNKEGKKQQNSLYIYRLRVCMQYLSIRTYKGKILPSSFERKFVINDEGEII